MDDRTWVHKAPIFLAVLDRNLVCRQASRGWLERLGVRAGQQALAMPLDALFKLADQTALPDRLRDLLHNGMPLHAAPVTLTGTSGMTRGLLSAWRTANGTEEPRLYLSATCSDALDAALSELQNLRTMHELILDAAGEGIYGLDCEDQRQRRTSGVRRRCADQGAGESQHDRRPAHANGRIWGSEGAAALWGLKPSTLTYRMKVLGIRKEA